MVTEVTKSGTTAKRNGGRGERGEVLLFRPIAGWEGGSGFGPNQRINYGPHPNCGPDSRPLTDWRRLGRTDPQMARHGSLL
jgi:hypothetical protein